MARTKAVAPDQGNKLTMEYLGLDKIVPYEHNPRDNAAAVDAVAKSIQDFGFLVPVVVDKDGVLAAGHTRYLAAKKLGMTEVPTLRADHLTEAQIKAFRLIDNKVSELATWDFDLLAHEIAALTESGIDMLPFGWTKEELDCLGDLVVDDCLDIELDEDKQQRDGVNNAIQTNKGSNVVSRDPTSIRVAIGEINFFVDIKHYQEWAHEVRRVNSFNMESVVADLAGRLGLNPRPFGKRKDDAGDHGAAKVVGEELPPVETKKLAKRGPAKQGDEPAADTVQPVAPKRRSRAHANQEATAQAAADAAGPVIATNPQAVAAKVNARTRKRS